MPGIQARTQPRMTGKFPPNARDAARAVRATSHPWAEAVALGFEHLSASVDSIVRSLQQSGSVDDFLVTDGATGRVLAALGQYEVAGVTRSGGYFSELYAGDPYGNSDPAYAILSVTTDGKVQVGQNGWIDVLDPFEESAAWIGTMPDSLAVTGAADNGSGLIRLTIASHPLATGDSVRVWDVGGVPNATGIFTVTKINANTIDLQNSVFVGSYTSGGYVNRVLHISGAANNGSGLIRITTAVAHSYESGDKVNIQNVAGVTAANGQWIITVIDSTHFDLVGSTFAGVYSAGTGICLRYFAGMLAQTIAIGPSFVDYRLRAFADGSLKIHDATIVLDSASGTITLDPTGPSITVADAGGNTWATLEILTEAPQSISAATNASPSVITINSHGYVDGDTLLIAGATGNTAINGYRIVVYISANTFSLTDMAGVAINGNGAYTGSGTATRYYGGGLFQTIAIGESFANYKLRAFADGTLRISNATIELESVSGGVTSTIELDPSLARILVSSSLGSELELRNGYVKISELDSGGVLTDSGLVTLELGLFQMYATGIGTLPDSRVVDLYGYTGSDTVGPVLSFSQAGGTPSTPDETASGDVLGGFVAFGYDGSWETDYAAGVLAEATENHATGSQGALLRFYITPNTTATAVNAMTLGQDQSLSITGVYKVSGTQVLGTRKTGWGTPTGTLSRLTFDQSTVTLPGLAQRVAALVTDLISHGAIGA